MSNDPTQALSTPDMIVEDASGEPQPAMIWQILTGVFSGLSLILLGVLLWVSISRSSGRSKPAPDIRGGFSLGSLGALMSTS